MGFNKKRLETLFVGFFVDRLVVWIIDLWIYPVVIRKYGFLQGGVYMVIISFLACYGTILIYDKMKIDWLAIEESKEAAASQESGLKRKVMQGMRFILISCAFDPFWTVVYLRDGSHQYNGLTRKDWNVFIASLVVSNLFWNVVTTTSLIAFEDNIAYTATALAVITMGLPLLRKWVSKAVSN